MTEPVHASLTLNFQVLHGLANTPSLVSKFPFLASVKGLNPDENGCGGCTSPSRVTAAEFSAVSKQIKDLSPSRKLELKTLLRARRIHIQFYDRGKLSHHTF